MPRGGLDWGILGPQKPLELLLREGNAFGHEGYQAAVAAKYAWLQVWNPSDSGVDALIYRVDHVVSGDTRIALDLGNSEFTTDEGAGTNRKAGLTISDLHVRKKTDASQITIAVAMDYSLAGTVRSIYPCYIWIPPGKSCDLCVKTVNTEIRTVWWWFEFVSEEL